MNDLFPHLRGIKAYLELMKLLSSTNLHLCDCKVTKIEFSLDINMSFLKEKTY